MSIDQTYMEAAIETLDLIHQLINYTHENKETAKISEYLSQIQTKADARISSSLGQRLGIQIPVDQEGKPTKYWEGVRDMAKLGTSKWNANQNVNQFTSFCESTRSSLAKRLGIVDSEVNPLEAMIEDQPAPQVEVETANPLEEILSTPQPAPEPIPTPSVEFKPTPEPVKEPVPEPVIPSMPKIEPEIKTPDLKVIPTPEPIIPEPIIKKEPNLEASQKLDALDEALQSSGLEPSPQSSPSLSDMLLSNDEKNEDKEEEDDLLSLSLRDALKILRDEDED